VGLFCRICCVTGFEVCVACCFGFGFCLGFFGFCVCFCGLGLMVLYFRWILGFGFVFGVVCGFGIVGLQGFELWELVFAGFCSLGVNVAMQGLGL